MTKKKILTGLEYLPLTVKLVMTGSCLALFLYQSNLNMSLFLANKKVLTTTIEQPKSFQFPPVTVCPVLPYDPWGLEVLGFNMSSRWNLDLVHNMILLTGIDREMTGRKFFEVTRWDLGRLIEEVSVGKRKEVYDISATSDMWHQTFSKRRVCYTLRPPAVPDSTYNLTIRFRKDFGLIPCPVVKDTPNVDCEAVELHCNSSCGMEYAIGTFTHIFVEIPLSRDSKVIYNHPAPQFTSVGNVTLELYKVRLSEVSNDYDPDDCVFNCLNNMYLGNEGCKILDNRNLNEPLSKLCTIQKLEDRMYYKTISTCYESCSPTKHSIHWKIKNNEEGSDSLQLSLASSQMEAIEEVKVYSLSKLLADIGGNMGLLLGLSLISVLFNCPQYLILLSRRLRRKDATQSVQTRSSEHIRTLCRKSASCFFLLISLVHLCSFLYVYVHQAEQNIISFDQHFCMEGHLDTCTRDTGIEDWVAGHFASRSLGCRVEPPSHYGSCLQKCLVHEIYKLQPDLLPYMIVDDMPRCSSTNLNMNTFTYHMPGFIAYKTVLAHDDICASKCEGESRSISGYFKWPFPRIGKTKPINTIQLLCNTGGIIGLYFGYCLLDIPEMILNKFHLQRKRLRSAIMFFISIIVGVLAMTICLQQVYVFFYKNPVLTENRIVPLPSSSLPAITLCPWPPFNLTMLESYNAYNISYNTFSLSYQEIQDYIESLMNIAQSKNEMSDIWSNIWNHDFKLDCTLITKGNSNKMYSPTKVLTSLGQCYMCIANKNEESILSQALGVSVYDPSVKDAYILFHESNNIPFWSANEVTPSAPAAIINIKTIDEFQPRNGNGIDYNSCMSNCLHEMVKNYFDCEVPPLRRTEHENFNISGCSGFLAFLLEDSAKPNHQSHFFKNHWKAVCNSTCKHTRFVAYDIEFKRSYFSTDLFKRIGSMQFRLLGKGGLMNGRISVTKEHKQIIEEFDAYVFIQLLSDLGGVGGFTVGISLLTLLLSLVKCSHTLRNHSFSM